MRSNVDRWETNDMQPPSSHPTPTKVGEEEIRKGEEKDRGHGVHIPEWKQERLQQLRDLGEEMFRKTKNITDFSPDILIENPKDCLRFYTLLTRRSLEEISQLAGLTSYDVIGLAFGKYVNPSRRAAENLMEAIETICQSQMLAKNPRSSFENSLRQLLLLDCKSGEAKNSRNYPSIHYMDEWQFTELYALTEEGTSGFTEFDPMLLVSNPQSMLVFRMILNASRNVMARILGEEQESAVQNYENALEPAQRYKTAKQYMAELEEIFHALDLTGNVNLEATMGNFRNLRCLIHEIQYDLTHEYLTPVPAQTSRNTIARQEQALIDRLEKADIRCYTPKQPKPREPCCMIHAPLWDGHKHKYFDFAFCDNQNPKAIIECATVESIHNEQLPRTAQDRGRQVLPYYPGAKFIVVVHGSHQPIVAAPYFLDLPDAVFTDTDVQNLPEFLKRLTP